MATLTNEMQSTCFKREHHNFNLYFSRSDKIESNLPVLSLLIKKALSSTNVLQPWLYFLSFFLSSCLSPASHPHFAESSSFALLIGDVLLFCYSTSIFFSHKVLLCLYWQWKSPHCCVNSVPMVLCAPASIISTQITLLPEVGPRVLSLKFIVRTENI